MSLTDTADTYASPAPAARSAPVAGFEHVLRVLCSISRRALPITLLTLANSLPTLPAAAATRSLLPCETFVVAPTPVCVNQSFDSPDQFEIRSLSAPQTMRFSAPGVSGPVTVDGFWGSTTSTPATVAIRELGVLRASISPSTFVPSDPLADAPGSALPETSFILGGAERYLVSGDQTHVALGLLAGQIPIVGTGGRIDLFLPGPSGTVWAIGNGPGGGALGLYRCASAYACTQLTQTLTGQQNTIAYARSGASAVFATTNPTKKVSVWLWTGRQLERLPSLGRYASRITTAGIPTFSLGLATDNAQPTVVRITYDPIPDIAALAGDPSDCMFASTDRQHWHAIYYAGDAEQPTVTGPPGARAAPWLTHYSVSANPASIAWLGSRLTALVATGDTGTLWQAHDGTGSWLAMHIR